MADLTELREIPAQRARLDAAELELIDRARRAGATWPEIAEALGLASRQAAEQRRSRLARAVPTLDQGYGEAVPYLRESAADLHRRIAADRRWDRRFARAALVRETLRSATEAPAGGLFDLVAAALSDLSGADVPPLPGALHLAVNRLRERWAAATPD
ncbi:hypothetical protein AB0M02_16435 [Actinoplanes sp. NPDC051861]|uniref:hypothetical protein n=1 Tax=Actinoplanes sp. NPDC051861 TaxID=3155170 RepID=UPI0034424CBA